MREYVKIHLQEITEWDEIVQLAQHAYDTTDHEALGYPPHEVAFDRRGGTPSRFPPQDQIRTINEYLAESPSMLAQLQTMAGMNLVQSKHRTNTTMAENRETFF